MPFEVSKLNYLPLVSIKRKMKMKPFISDSKVTVGALVAIPIVDIFNFMSLTIEVTAGPAYWLSACRETGHSP